MSSNKRAWAKTAIRTYGTDYFSSEEEIFKGKRKLFTDYTTNPYTGKRWTWDEIDDLEAGIALKAEYVWPMPSHRAFQHGCHKLYVVVKCFSGDATVWEILEEIIQSIGGHLYYKTRSEEIMTIRPNLRINAGDNAADVIRNLLMLVPDVLVFQGLDGYIINPLTTADPNYYYIWQGGT